MYSETTELTYSHLDLGALNEFGLMCLFGSLHSKALVRGLAITVEDIKDHHGRRLYPAYFHTHLRVPESCPLSRFSAWRRVQLGIELRRFGKCYLDSSYVIKPEGDPVPAPADFESGAYPTMHGNNLFIVDVSEDSSVARQLAAPESARVAPLEPVGEKPVAIQRARETNQDRTLRKGRHYSLSSHESIAYAVVPGRDVAVGHAMIFARFCQVMDYAEHIFLTEQLELLVGQSELAEHHLLEREIFYFNNAYAGDTIDIGVKACVIEEAGRAGGSMVVETEYQLFRRSNLDLLAIGYARKGVGGESARRLFSPLASEPDSLVMAMP
jgi:probable biosynthetic protein (TIGR04098 family)